MRILIAAIKSWNIENAGLFSEKYGKDNQIKLITKKEELNSEDVSAFSPDYIFFPHWSYIIPEDIFKRFPCVVFHMTDLPFGRGGSPLQNLIVRGYRETKISALKVEKAIDAGPVYMKEHLGLEGTADEILRRASDIIFTKMMPRFLNEKLIPVAQEGETVSFKRRTKEQGELTPDMSFETLYDYIRMLDGEGYPRAFVRFGDYSIEFSDACLSGNCLEAHIRFVKGEE